MAGRQLPGNCHAVDVLNLERYSQPQGLKPQLILRLNGTAKAVPFHVSVKPWPSTSRLSAPFTSVYSRAVPRQRQGRALRRHG
jgi:hypothetical protein